IPLTSNFRTVRPLIEWINGCFGRVFPTDSDDYSPADRPLDVGRTDGFAQKQVADASPKNDDELSFDLQVGELDSEEPVQAAHNTSLYSFSQIPVERLLIPSQLWRNDEVAEYEAHLIARTIRHAIDCKWRVPRSQSERALGLPSHAVPSDFLIIARNRTR